MSELLFPDMGDPLEKKPVIRGNTIRTAGGHTARRIPWWKSLGPGPADKTCNDCASLVRFRRTRTYTKCSRQIITHGPGTDISGKDAACRLFVEKESDDADRTS